MDSSNQPGSMFNGRFVIVMVLVFAGWVGWQSYLAKKYPEAYKAKSQAPAEAAKDTAANEGAPLNETSKEKTTSATPKGVMHEKPEPAAESFLVFEDGVWTFKISTYGMTLKDVRLKTYDDREGNPIGFATEEDLGLFGTGLIGRRDLLNFEIRKTGENEYVGVAQVDGMKITKILQIESQNYLVKTQVRAENLTEAFTGFATTFSDRIRKAESGFFLMPQFEHQEFFALHENTDSRTVVNETTAMVETFPQTTIASFGSQYFATAMVDKSPILAEFKAVTLVEPKPLGLATVTHSLLNKSDKFAIEYIGFAGPKSYDLLKSIDADMTKVINLGFFQSISKGILWLMKTLHSALGNWGVAIIFLTILVRILVLPFNLIGYKQMKAMTKIQPQMKALREKYKNDPQRLNQEMLTLMKEAKANPLGGCLPMFLQIPIFFALYQVIGQSIELYKAPFFFWIQDLSLKDPFYILPILMGVTMFIQQKVTPNTLEPAQQKIMLILPVFFTFLMVTLPSGLTLYIFISSVFGVLQQLYFTKDNRVQATA